MSAMPGTTSRADFEDHLDGRRVVPVVRVLFADSETPLGIFRKLAMRADGRMRPGAFRVVWRAQSPSGPVERTVTCAVVRSPRRYGVSCRANRRRSPAGIEIAARLFPAPAEGCQPSRTTPRRVRVPVLVRNSSLVTGSPSRTRLGSTRPRLIARGEAATARSRLPSARTNTSQPARTRPACPMLPPNSTMGTTPRATSATNRPVSVMG